MSAREVVEAAIARIEKLDPALNAVVGERFEQALAEVDAGLPDGPLRGVPTLVKDAVDAMSPGLPTTGGSRLFARQGRRARQRARGAATGAPAWSSSG